MRIIDNIKRKRLISSIPIVSDEEVVPYDEYDSSYDLRPGGMRKKRFYRASTGLFPDLIEDLKEGSSYVTHCNDLIKNHDYTPAYMSSLLKSTHVDKGVKEIIASRLMNYFEVPTTYEMLVRMPEDKNPKCQVLSVDFISKDEQLYTFNDMGIMLDRILESDAEQIRERMETFYRGKRACYPFMGIINRDRQKFQIDKMIKKYIASTLVRSYIICDRDFHSANCGVLINENNMSMNSFVNFDYEYAFNSDLLTDQLMVQDFRFALTMYPEIFGVIYDKINELLSISKDEQYIRLYDFLNDCVPNTVNNKHVYEFIEHRLKHAQEVCDKVISELFHDRDNYEKFVR